MKRLVAVLALIGSAALFRCGPVHLVYLPLDLAREVRSRAVEPGFPPAPEDAGVVESALHEDARRAGRPELLIDTGDPVDDAKLRARACDQGDLRACGSLGGWFAFLLGAPELGLELWERSCDAGHEDACAAAADLYARSELRMADSERALALDLRACTPRSRRPYTCRRAARAESLAAADRFRLLDRGCELGDRVSCSELLRLLAGAPLGLPPEDPLRVYYQERELGAGANREVIARDGVPESPGGTAGDPASLRKREIYARLRTEGADPSRPPTSGRAILLRGPAGKLIRGGAE